MRIVFVFIYIKQRPFKFKVKILDRKNYKFLGSFL